MHSESYISFYLVKITKTLSCNESKEVYIINIKKKINEDKT